MRVTDLEIRTGLDSDLRKMRAHPDRRTYRLSSGLGTETGRHRPRKDATLIHQNALNLCINARCHGPSGWPFAHQEASECCEQGRLRELPGMRGPAVRLAFTVPPPQDVVIAA